MVVVREGVMDGEGDVEGVAVGCRGVEVGAAMDREGVALLEGDGSGEGETVEDSVAMKLVGTGDWVAVMEGVMEGLGEAEGVRVGRKGERVVDREALKVPEPQLEREGVGVGRRAL